MRLIDAEEFKHKINNSELYGTDEWAKVLDMLAECETRNSTIETAIKDYYDDTSLEVKKTLKEYYERGGVETMEWVKIGGEIHCSNCYHKISSTVTPSRCPCCGRTSVNRFGWY